MIKVTYTKYPSRIKQGLQRLQKLSTPKSFKIHPNPLKKLNVTEWLSYQILDGKTVQIDPQITDIWQKKLAGVKIPGVGK